MGDKDIDITVLAVIKSVVETGCPKEEYGPRAEEALSVWYRLTDTMREASGRSNK